MQVQIEYNPLLIEVERSLRQHPKFNTLTVLPAGRVLADDLMRRRMQRRGAIVHIRRDPMVPVKHSYDPYTGETEKADLFRIGQLQAGLHGITPEMAAAYTPEELEIAERNLQQQRNLDNINELYGTMQGRVQKQVAPNVLHAMLAQQLEGRRRMKKNRTKKR